MQRTGAAAAALALPELQRTSRFKMGLQLYTVRAPTSVDTQIPPLIDTANPAIN